MEHKYVSLDEVKLPIHEIELMEDELLLVRGGCVPENELTENEDNGGSGCGCGCGCGCG